MKKGWYWPPVCTLAIGLVIYAAFSLFPFSNLTIAWCDMKQQVIPLLIEFKQILSGEADFFFNFQNAGGMNFFGPFFFFLSSPFTFLVAFVPAEEIYMLVNILVLLKMAVAALTAGCLFRSVYPVLGTAQSTALSVMYAFSGYTMLYFQNLVWLDMLYVFPLVLLGLIQLAKTGKIWLFFFSFCAAIVIQFYLTYMVLLFVLFASVLYAYICMPKDARSVFLFRFSAAILAAFLVTAVVWMPLMAQYAASARATGLLTSLLTGGIWARWETTLTTVLCNMLMFAAIPMLFFFPRKTKQIPTVPLLLFFMMLLPLGIEPINKMWHTGSYQAFPSRYGFVTVLCGLILAAEALSRLDRWNAEKHLPDSLGKRVRSVFLPCLGLILFALAGLGTVLLVGEREALTVYMRRLWLNQSFLKAFLQFGFVALILYLLLMLLYRFRMLTRRMFTVFLCAVTVCESMFCGSIFLGYAGNDITFNREVFDLSGKIEEDSLYRVKLQKKYFDINLIGALGYGSLGHYTSFTDADTISTMKKLGYSSYWMEVSPVGGTEFSDAILGQRYTIDRIGTLSDGDDPVYTNDRFVIRKNPDAFSVGMVVDGFEALQAENGFPLAETERIPEQNGIFQRLFQTNETLFETYEPETMANLTMSYDTVYSYRRTDELLTGILYYQIDVKGTQTLYFDCFNEISVRLREVINGGCNVYVNGEPIETEYPTQKNNGILELGTFTDESVLVEIELLKDINARSFGVYGLKHETMETYFRTVSCPALTQKGNTLSGTATAERAGQYLFLPIPYGTGYSAHVNGEPVEICCVFDGYLAIPLAQGENTISVSYIPPGLIAGAAISVMGILILIWLKRQKPMVSACEQKLKQIVSYVVTSAFAIALFLIYFFPLLVRIIAALKT